MENKNGKKRKREGGWRERGGKRGKGGEREGEEREISREIFVAGGKSWKNKMGKIGTSEGIGRQGGGKRGMGGERSVWVCTWMRIPPNL